MAATRIIGAILLALVTVVQAEGQPTWAKVSKAQVPKARIIKLLPWGLKRYKPSGDTATRWLANGRALILTGFPDNEPKECRRPNCLKNNQWIQHLASSAGPLAQQGR